MAHLDEIDVLPVLIHALQCPEDAIYPIPGVPINAGDSPRLEAIIDGYGCGYYYCGTYSGEQSSTTGWRTSWNAGFGGEVAMPGHTSFFMEVRYQRIAPQDNERQFVPVRVGIRF